MPSVAMIWADGGYAGRLVGYARQLLKVLVDIVRKREGQRTFEVLPRRWVVRAHAVMDQPVPTTGARLRAAARAPRSHGAVRDGRPDGPPAGPGAGAAPVGDRQILLIDLKHVLRSLPTGPLRTWSHACAQS